MIVSGPPGTPTQIAIDGLASGLVGTLGFAIYGIDGSLARPFSTVGVSEIDAAGIYTASVPAPSPAGDFWVVWSGGIPSSVSEEWQVSAAAPPAGPPNARPSVEDVATFIRARTQDEQGNEVGTFDSDTRPTDVQVQDHIAAAQALVELRLPALDRLSPVLLPAVAVVVALEAACQIEKSYWPEQVATGRSPYEQLRAEADAALAMLAEQAAAGGTEFVSNFAAVPIGSWTSMGAWP